MGEDRAWPTFHEAIVIWEHFYTTHNIVSRNTEELIELFRRISFPGETSEAYMRAVASGNPRDKTKDAVDLEINRAVFNYLASIATLVDISRNTMRHYEGSRAEKEYAERVARIRAQGLGPLLVRMRAHVVHRARLPWKVRVYLGAHDRLLDVVVDRKELLSHGDIGGPALRYLKSFEDDVPFVDLVTAYGKQLAVLNVWLWEQLQVLYPVPRPPDWPSSMFDT